jgi:murein DD-endopeptidase MepM/ murein hydrolase activator NlpD
MGKGGGTKGWCLFVAIFMALPFVAVLIFVTLYVITVNKVVENLPPWAQTPGYEWMMGIPQNSDFHPGDDVSFGNTGPIAAGPAYVPWDGYSDLATASIYGVPLVMPAGKKPLLGCPFGRNPGYTMNGGIHNGADFPIPTGTPVQAIMGGKVVYAGFNLVGGAWGGLVVVENSEYQTWYAHMEQINVIQGQIIERGTVVGLSDNLGNSTGPHLHLGVKKGGDGSSGYWIDPMQFISPDLYNVGGCG